MKQPRSPSKKGASFKTKGGKTSQESSRAQIASGTPSREQVREATSPRVNVPRQSKRPMERSNQSRSRRS
jgi:hypothetical protein